MGAGSAEVRGCGGAGDAQVRRCEGVGVRSGVRVYVLLSFI